VRPRPGPDGFELHEHVERPATGSLHTSPWGRRGTTASCPQSQGNHLVAPTTTVPVTVQPRSDPTSVQLMRRPSRPASRGRHPRQVVETNQW
jgi:hypothetical protein